MRQLAVGGRLLALWFVLCTALSACAVQLAAPYDSAIVANLDTANQDVHQLFAQVGTIVDASTFPTRKPLYDKIVGELGALDVQIRARPTPNPKAIQKATAALQRVHVASIPVDPNFTAYPSARAVGDLARIIQRMEDQDSKHGLRGGATETFRGFADLYLQQAITYENYLKR